MKEIPASWVQFQQLAASYMALPEINNRDRVIPSLQSLARLAKCSNQLPSHFVSAGYLEAVLGGHIYKGPANFETADWLKIRSIFRRYNFNKRLKANTKNRSANTNSASKLTDMELINELKARGYTGTIEKKQTINF